MLLPLASAPLAAQSQIELEGPISSVDGTKIALFEGMVVFDAAGAEFDSDDKDFKSILDLRPGAVIEVEATVAADGTIRASELEVSDDRNPDTEIGGVIATVDDSAKSFTIGPVTIHWDGGTRFRDLDELRAGVTVEADVEIHGGRLRAVMVEREDDD